MEIILNINQDLPKRWKLRLILRVPGQEKESAAKDPCSQIKKFILKFQVCDITTVWEICLFCLNHVTCIKKISKYSQ